MKYVYCSPERFRIFGDLERHSDVARELGETPESAGFCRFRADGSLEVYGESDSLGIASNPVHGRYMSIFLREQRAVA